MKLPPDLEGGYPYIFPIEFLTSYSSGNHIFPMTIQEAFSCISKFAGAFLFMLSSGSTSDVVRDISSNKPGSEPGSSISSSQVRGIASANHSLARFHLRSRSKGQPAVGINFEKILRLSINHLFSEVEKLQSCSALSLAAAFIPPFDRLSSEILGVPLENVDAQVHESMDQRLCEVGRHDYAGFSFPDLKWKSDAVEPRTGIEFPTILENGLDGHTSRVSSEVLVGTGSKTLRVIKIKSLKLYAFGFYVHPSSVCQKLGPKYASIPSPELNKCDDFYLDLLREDISMSVRLVVNYNGLKINTMKDAFEQSLRARLVKTNPETDYHCLKAFESLFTQNIPIPMGTVINIRRTGDGQLITEIGGDRIGAVQSKELCRAFFDMYIGDLPVSDQTKEEIGRNVAGIIKRC